MPASDRREREKQELRIKILDAARELFAAEGYEAVTMRKIAERIEYSPTAIYGHFKDKNALIRELCENDFQAFAQRFANLVAISDPIERMRQAGVAYFSFALESPRHYQLMFMTRRPPIEGEDISKANDPALNAYVFLQSTVKEAMAGGLFRPELTNPEVVAQTIWAALHGVVALQITAHEPDDKWMAWASLDERRTLMTDVILRGLLREPRTKVRTPLP